MTRVDCGICVWCGRRALVEVEDRDAERAKAWVAAKRKGGDHEPVQVAWGHLSVGDRETMQSGLHSACFDRMFPPEHE